MPLSRIAASNAARGKGSTPDAASAPNSGAEITEPSATASASKSAAMTRRAAIAAAARTGAEAAMPSPGTVFSDTASARWVEAISVVRSGVTKPRWMARPASIISAAIRMSTSPAAGISAKTGSAAPGRCGAIST